MRRGLTTLLVLIVVLLGLELLVAHWLAPLENRLLDDFVRRHAAALAPDPDVVLVSIDERSLAQMEEVAGRFPWPRAVYATLLDAGQYLCSERTMYRVLAANHEVRERPVNREWRTRFRPVPD